MEPLKSQKSLVPYLLGIFVLIPFIAKPFFIIAIFVYQLIRCIGSYNFRFRKEYLWMLSLVFANILGLVFTQDFHYALEYFLRLIPFVLLIPILANECINQDFIKKFNSTFVLSTCLFSFIYLIYNVYCIYFTNLDTLDKSLSYSTNYLFGFHEHPIYVSIYIGISLLILLQSKLNLKNTIIVVFLISILLVLARKGPILYLAMTLFIYMVLTKKNIKKGVVYVGMVIILLVITYPFWFDRFYEMFQHNYTNSTGIRIVILQSTLQLLSDCYYLGYGTGDAKQVLNEYLQNYTTVVPYPYDYNCHNEYLEIMMKSGILGLMVFLWGQFNVLKKTHKTYFIGFLIMVFIYLNMLTESMLERQNGLLIYGIFMGIYVLIQKSKDE